MAHSGIITKIIGVVVDVAFTDGYIPQIYEALEVQGAPTKLVLEVQQQLGDGIVRTIAMNPVDGVRRGLTVVATGAPISVPVGDAVLGRMFNVLGDPIDNMDAPVTERRDPIHRKSPSFEELSTKTEIFETGIKVVDLIAPMLKGGKVGLFGGAGVGKTVIGRITLAHFWPCGDAVRTSPRAKWSYVVEARHDGGPIRRKIA